MEPGSSLCYIWQLVERRRVAKRGLQNASTPSHSHTHTQQPSQNCTQEQREFEGKRALPPQVTQATGGFIKPEITNRQVTAGPAFPLLSPHWAFLSLYVAWLTAAGMEQKKKRSLWVLHLWSLTVGLYTDAPAEGLYVPVALQLWIFFFCHEDLDWWETFKNLLALKVFVKKILKTLSRRRSTVNNFVWPGVESSSDGSHRTPAPVRNTDLRV